MPADIQVNHVSNASMQSKMASENSVFYEKLAEEVRSYTCLYDKSSDDFKDTNKKKLCWKDVAEAVAFSTGKVNII